MPGPRRVEGTGQRLFWYSVCAGGANNENSTKMIEHDIFFKQYMDIWNDTQIYVRASCTRHTKKYVATKQTQVRPQQG